MQQLKKNIKKPEIRRKELIDVAFRLFTEKGYESVSVRDILDEVNGAPGMFYYYFKSKQDIYLAAMEDYLNERLERKCKILEDDSISFDEKKEVYRSLVTEDIAGYVNRFQPQKEHSIADDAYKLWDFVQMLNKMSKPHAKFILQGVQEGKISDDLGITVENVEAFALYSLYGAWGLIHNGTFTDSQSEFDVTDVYKLVHSIFYRNI
ncbi:MAG: TetR/AcrR family transcriptional regulator [Hespellia sp.]|nr:TetR/AcrR family transcriptional regulator [Hespellia sp.]